MSKVTTFTRPVVRNINNDIETALAKIAKDYGVSINVNGCRFSDNEMKPRIVINTVDENGAVTESARNFETYKEMYGLGNANLGDTFTSQGSTFRLTGIKPSRRRYPISAECVRTGRSFKFTAECVQAGLK